MLRVTNHISRAPLNQALEINLSQRVKPLCRLQVCAMKCKEPVLAVAGACNV